MGVKITRMPEKRVASVRHTGPYEQCGKAWEALCAWAGPKELFGPQAEFYGLCHDDPKTTPPERIRYDACMTVPESVEDEGDVFIQAIGGGDYAQYLHKGPYDGLFQVYAAIYGEWAPSSGRNLADKPCIEQYLNDPTSTPEDELLTMVFVALE